MHLQAPSQRQCHFWGASPPATRPDYQINGGELKKDIEAETMTTTYISGPLIMRNNLFMICPGEYRAGSETRNAGEDRESRASWEHGGRWCETVRVKPPSRFEEAE